MQKDQEVEMEEERGKKLRNTVQLCLAQERGSGKGTRREVGERRGIHIPVPENIPGQKHQEAPH